MEELGGMMTQTSDQKPTKEELKMMMDSVDTDGDVFISFDEFCGLMTEPKKEGSDNMDIKQAFQFFDKDNDGHITMAELNQVADMLGTGLTKKERKNMFTQADTNGDGKIDFE